MRVVISAEDLPGRTWQDKDAIQVGIQLGRDPADLVPADAASARWETEVEVTDSGDFRGPAVQGKKGERFLYLTWVAGSEQQMFRRLKLMLAEAPAAASVRAELSLTDECGGPRCGRAKPPAISWSSS